MSNTIAGFNGAILVGGTKIAEVQDVTLTIDLKTIDATSHDSAGWMEKIAGNIEWKATAKALYVFGDAVRQTVRDALINKTTVTLVVQPKYNTVGQEKFTGTAWISKYTNALPNEAAAAVDVEFEGTGALTAGTQ
jgi:predicted secreted protein